MFSIAHNTCVNVQNTERYGNQTCYASLGDKDKDKNQPPVRLQLLVGGAFFLFIGLLMFGVIRL